MPRAGFQSLFLRVRFEHLVAVGAWRATRKFLQTLGLIIADFCAECVSKKLGFPARVLLHTSLHPHYLKNMHFNTGMGTAQNFCPATGYHGSCFSAVLLGLPFAGIACSTYLDNYIRSELHGSSEKVMISSLAES